MGNASPASRLPRVCLLLVNFNPAARGAEGRSFSPITK
jgi:hypothetical protein